MTHSVNRLSACCLCVVSKKRTNRLWRCAVIDKFHYLWKLSSVGVFLCFHKTEERSKINTGRNAKRHSTLLIIFNFLCWKKSQQTKTKADAIIVGRELSWHWFMIEILSCFRLRIQVSDTMCKFSIWTNVVITYSIFIGYYKIAYGIPYIPEFSESKWPK